MPPIDTVYADLWALYGEELVSLKSGPRLRSWELLYEIAGGAGLNPGSLVLDPGCGRGGHGYELSSRFGCRVLGIDVVRDRLQDAAARDGGAARCAFAQATIERMPLRSGAVDFVWCTGMLVHVKDVRAALGECARVLRRGGAMLAMVTVETSWMGAGEGARIYAPLAMEPSSLNRRQLEAAFDAAGFAVLRIEELDSELAECEEDGGGSRELIRLARMRRQREALTEAWGSARYETIYAFHLWIVYQLLGKLTSAGYLLMKR